MGSKQAAYRGQAKIPNVISTIMPVETTRQLADALLVALEAVAVEHRERDEREGIVRLAN